MSASIPFPVHPLLRPYVRAIHLEDQPEGVGAIRVPPGPLSVAGFQRRGRLRVQRDDGEQRLDVAGITGLQTTARSFVPQGDTSTILVVFEPAGAFALLGCPLHEMANKHVGFAAILGDRRVRTTCDRLTETQSHQESADIVQAFLRTCLEQARPRPHPLIHEAVRILTHCRGRERIDDLAKNLGVCRRHLERLFLQQIGVGPKEFASLTRFEWLLGRLRLRRDWASLAHEAGFADQAHFIRHFRARTGSSPEEYVRQLSA